MKRLPTLKQLRFFVSLEKNMHFGKAAKECFVAQPTFSVAIKELENSLGVKLAERTNKAVFLTPIGKEVANRARDILLQAEELSDIVSGQRKPLSSQLRLGVIPTIAPFVLPLLIRKILRRYPNLRLQVKEDITNNIYQDLISGKLDLLLLALPYEMKNVETLSLFRDPFLFAFDKNTKLASKNAYTSSDALPDESILLLEDGHCLRDHALTACDVRQARKISPYTTSSLHTLVQMVDSDLGVTFVPELAVNSGLLEGTNVQLSKMPEFACREIGFAWRKNAVREQEFLLFAEFFKNLASELHNHEYAA